MKKALAIAVVSIIVIVIVVLIKSKFSSNVNTNYNNKNTITDKPTSINSNVLNHIKADTSSKVTLPQNNYPTDSRKSITDIEKQGLEKQKGQELRKGKIHNAMRRLKELGVEDIMKKFRREGNSSKMEDEAGWGTGGDLQSYMQVVSSIHYLEAVIDDAKKIAVPMAVGNLATLDPSEYEVGGSEKVKLLCSLIENAIGKEEARKLFSDKVAEEQDTQRKTNLFEASKQFWR